MDFIGAIASEVAMPVGPFYFHVIDCDTLVLLNDNGRDITVSSQSILRAKVLLTA